jgi:hypothetical protein
MALKPHGTVLVAQLQTLVDDAARHGATKALLDILKVLRANQITIPPAVLQELLLCAQ